MGIVENEYGHLGEGESIGGQVCPFCEGGSGRDRSFSVTRERGKLLYICHRASCGERGAVRIGKPGYPSPSRSKPARTFLTRPDDIPQKVLEYLHTKYLLSPERLAVHGVGWTTSYSSEGRGRLYLPVYGRRMEQRGYTCRSLDGEVPKSLHFKYADDSSKMAWSRVSPPGSVCVLVEDQLSSYRAAPYVQCAALLGTSLSRQDVDELKRAACSTIYLALDKDATTTAVKTVLGLRSFLPIKVLRLSKDLKDSSEEGVRDLLTELS